MGPEYEEYFDESIMQNLFDVRFIKESGVYDICGYRMCILSLFDYVAFMQRQVEKIECDILIGHFDPKEMEEVLKADKIEFTWFLLGDEHSYSKRGNIVYSGCPFQFSFSD